MPYIVVDAGHGGWDKGAHFGGYNEKDITLRVATKVSNRLRQIGFKVTQLRTDDTYIGNASARGRQIAELQPNLAISIHVNSAGGTGEYSGAEIYVPIKEDSARFEYYLREELSRLNAFRENCILSSYSDNITPNNPLTKSNKGVIMVVTKWFLRLKVKIQDEYSNATLCW